MVLCMRLYPKAKLCLMWSCCLTPLCGVRMLPPQWGGSLVSECVGCKAARQRGGDAEQRGARPYSCNCR